MNQTVLFLNGKVLGLDSKEFLAKMSLKEIHTVTHFDQSIISSQEGSINQHWEWMIISHGYLHSSLRQRRQSTSLYVY